MSGPVIDLFAGPGGWDVAATRLGIDPLGVEWDDAACATRRAAGLWTLQADVASLEPQELLYEELNTDALDGLIASPPCQAWSMAGKGGGRRDKREVVACAHDQAQGFDTRAQRREGCEDERSMLVVEPIRWVRQLQPRWVALEQVPPVIGLWEMFAQIMEDEWGYTTWTGVLEAERYGVPQTRERAILIARLDGPVAPPQATHQRYMPGEPARHDVTFDGEVLPWVSMAEALGWGMTERPGLTFAPGTGNGGAAYEGGSGARATLRRERRRGAWVVQMGNFTAQSRRGERGVMYERDIDQPAPTVTGNADRWGLDRRQGGAPVRLVDEPAHTMSSQGLAKGRDVWVDSANDPIRVTIEEAAALQTFPPGYPWQGTQGQKFQQIGNAVPPLLAMHVLGAVTGLAIGREDVAA